MKIIFPNIIASIKVLTGAFAFLLFIVVAAIRNVDLSLIFFFGIGIYFFFYMLGSVIASLLTQIEKENVIEPIKEKKTDYETDLKRQFDIHQSAEMPIFD